MLTNAARCSFLECLLAFHVTVVPWAGIRKDVMQSASPHSLLSNLNPIESCDMHAYINIIIIPVTDPTYANAPLTIAVLDVNANTDLDANCWSRCLC